MIQEEVATTVDKSISVRVPLVVKFLNTYRTFSIATLADLPETGRCVMSLAQLSLKLEVPVGTPDYDYKVALTLHSDERRLYLINSYDREELLIAHTVAEGDWRVVTPELNKCSSQ